MAVHPFFPKKTLFSGSLKINHHTKNITHEAVIGYFLCQPLYHCHSPPLDVLNIKLSESMENQLILRWTIGDVRFFTSDMWPLGTFDGWLDGHPSRHVGNSHPTVLQFLQKLVTLVVMHFVPLSVRHYDTHKLLTLVIVAMMFLKIHLLQVTQVKRNIQGIRKIFTPLFLPILRELFGARDSSKSLIIGSLELLFVFVACLF